MDKLVNTPVIPKFESTQDIEDFLREDEPVKEEIPKKEEDDEEEVVEEKEEKEEKPDELEKDAELELEGDEDIDIVTPVKFKEVTAKYPNFFKDFPQFKNISIREKEFTDVVATPQDARVAVEKANALDQFSDQLSSGDPRNLLKTVFENDRPGFNKLVDNYLPALAEIDKSAFHHIVTNLHKQTVFNMVQEARRTQNEGLEAAATLLYQFITGTTNYQQPTPYSKEDPSTKKDSGVEQERAQLMEERFQYAFNDLSTRVGNQLRATIDKFIDPKNVMTSYIKEKAISDALTMLDEALSRDTRFTSLMNSLWKDAASTKFSSDKLQKIRSTYLGRAKLSLKQVINVARTNATKDLRRTANTEENEERPRKVLTPGRAATQTNSGNKGLVGKDGKRLSTIDFLMQD